MGFISNTFGETCRTCSHRIDENIDECVSCFSQFIKPIEHGHCRKCLDPRPIHYQHYDQCYSCLEKIRNDEYQLDSVLACGYYYGDRSDFGFTLNTYKGTDRISQRSWMVFPLQALTLRFLEIHWDCIEKQIGEIEAVVPIPGRGSANLLKYFKQHHDQPILEVLRDTRVSGRYSGGARRNYDRKRFEVIADVPDKVLLFDDVFTGGSTAHSAAYVLRQHGAEKIMLFAVGKHINLTVEYLKGDNEFSVEKCSLCC